MVYFLGFLTKKACRNIPRPTGLLKIGRDKSGERVQTALDLVFFNIEIATLSKEIHFERRR